MLKYKVDYQDIGSLMSHLVTKNEHASGAAVKSNRRYDIFLWGLILAYILYQLYVTKSFLIIGSEILYLVMFFFVFFFFYRWYITGKPIVFSKKGQHKVNGNHFKGLYPDEDGYDVMLQLESDGLKSEGLGVNATYSFDSITGIDHYDGYTYINVGKMMGIVLPNKKIDAQEMAKFLDALRQKTHL